MKRNRKRSSQNQKDKEEKTLDLNTSPVAQQKKGSELRKYRVEERVEREGNDKVKKRVRRGECEKGTRILDGEPQLSSVSLPPQLGVPLTTGHQLPTPHWSVGSEFPPQVIKQGERERVRERECSAVLR